MNRRGLETFAPPLLTSSAGPYPVAVVRIRGSQFFLESPSGGMASRQKLDRTTSES